MHFLFSILQRGIVTGLLVGGTLITPVKVVAGPSSLANTSAGATGTFSTNVTYGTGGYPAAVATADFNKDGRPDIVTANTLDNTVSVLLNTGTGTFPSSGTSYTTAGSPVAVATGDFNLDGNIDIVTANLVNEPTLKTGSISILLGSGSGTFTLSASYGSGTSSFNSAGSTTPTSTSSPVAVAVGLLSTDAYPDVVVTNADGGTVGVFINTGSGTFPSAATLYTVGSRPAGVAIGDFNLDNHPDLAVANSLGNTVSILLNAGAGTFGNQVAYTVGSAPAAVAVGLFNSDAYPDVAVTNASDNTVSIVLNTGSGTFSNSNATYAVGSSPGALVALDLDVDGDVDVAAANSNGSTVSVLLNAGTGTFGTQTAYSTGSGPAGVAAGLLDTDTAPDLVTANSLSNSISVLIGAAATPTLTTINPTSGSVGTSIVLTGTNLAGATSVNFSGASVTSGLTVNTAGTTIAITVPTGASTGSVTVTTTAGTSNGLTFTVTTATASTTTVLASSVNPSTYGQATTLTATVTSSSGTPTGTVTFYDGTTSLGTGTLSSGAATLAVSTLAVGNHSLTAVYTASTNFATSTSATLTQVVTAATSSTTAAIRLHAGGAALSTSRGTFAADQYYSTSSAVGGTTATISGTSDQALYQTERYSTNGTLSYAVPVTNGQYQVVLHFAELYWTQAGKRVFDGYLEGAKVLDHYDIVQKVGALAAITESFPVTVSDGVLNLDLSVPYLTGGADQAKLSALEIIPVTPIYRLRAGDAALATTTHGSFAADQYYSANSAVGGTSTTIASTLDPALYQQERYSTNGTLSYALPVTNGQYEVVLHFAEIYWSQAGQRVFDINLEGNKVFSLYDIVKRVGPRTATTETFPVTVADGVLNLNLSVPYLAGGADQAKLSALEVLQVNTSTSTAAASRALVAAAATIVPSNLSTYPNPSAGAFTLTYTAEAAQAATLLLTDPLGRIWQQQAVSLRAGDNQVEVHATNLPEGLYRLTLRLANGQRHSQQVAIRP